MVESLEHYLHFVLIVQPILLAVQLFTYRGVFSRPHRVLGYYMVLITLYFFVNASFITIPAGIDEYAHLFIVPLFVSLNPFYFLYVRSLTSAEFRFRRICLLHFLPSLLLLILAIIGFWGGFVPELSAESIAAGVKPYTDFLRVETGIPSVYTAIVIYYLQFVIYTILMIKMLVQHKRKLAHYFSYTENISLNWLWFFMAIYAGFNLFDGIVYFTTLFESSKELYFLIMILFVNFLGYFGLKQTDIYLVRLKNSSVPFDPPSEITAVISNQVSVDIAENEVANRDGKYVGSSLSEEQKELLLKQLLELMSDQLVYSDVSLTISDIATRLKTNYKYISQVINEKLNKNFYNFVNEYRVNAAIRMIKDPEYAHLSLEGIAGLVGFKSRSAFNNAFKKVTGFPPGHFLKTS